MAGARARAAWGEKGKRCGIFEVRFTEGWKIKRAVYVCAAGSKV